jgi:hypothetical protein
MTDQPPDRAERFREVFDASIMGAAARVDALLMMREFVDTVLRDRINTEIEQARFRLAELKARRETDNPDGSAR